MSTNFCARFDSTDQNLDQILKSFTQVLINNQIKYSGSLIELVGHNGWPTVKNLNFQDMDINHMTKAALSWWGVGLTCISQSVVNKFGRGSSSEVDFSIFNGTNGRMALQYTESSSVTDYRIKSSEARQELIQLQVGLCQAAKFNISIYEEEDSEKPPLVTLRNLETTLKQIARDIGSEASIVVSKKLINIDRAYLLAGPRADEVQQTTNGYIVFPFLTGFPS